MHERNIAHRCARVFLLENHYEVTYFSGTVRPITLCSIRLGCTLMDFIPSKSFEAETSREERRGSRGRGDLHDTT
jgi:hypothetical protein